MCLLWHHRLPGYRERHGSVLLHLSFRFSFEKADTHRFEVPRMLLEEPQQLEAYILKTKDKYVFFTMFLLLFSIEFIVAIFSRVYSENLKLNRKVLKKNVKGVL